jgi:uncharacterized protein (TIGR02677 family)
VHAPKAAVYRRIMRAFVEGKRRFLVHFRPEDIAEQVGDGASVEGELTALVDWGNLRADPDTSRVTSVEDFYRARYLYQLTAEGEAAELALEAYDQALGRRGELQSVALEDIRVRAHNLLQQALLDAPDAAIAHNLLRELASLLENLAANASAFMSSLHHRAPGRWRRGVHRLQRPSHPLPGALRRRPAGQVNGDWRDAAAARRTPSRALVGAGGDA